jgi:hypothetical protein
LFTTFDGSSKAIKTEACRKLLNIIKPPKITGLVTDSDFVLWKILRTSGLNVKQFLEIGHAVKSFIRKFNAFNARRKRSLNRLDNHSSGILDGPASN